MDYDGGQETVVEGDPEEEHATEPRVQDTKEPLVLVTVPEEGVAVEQCRSDGPAVLTEDVRLELIKRGPVGQRSPGVAVKPLGEAEACPAEEQEVAEPDGCDGT